MIHTLMLICTITTVVFTQTPPYWRVSICQSQNCFVPSWLKLAQWFLRRRHLKFVNVLSLFRNYPPFENRVTLHLHKYWILNSRILCANFGWNWSSCSWEEVNVKRFQTDKGQTDNGQVSRKAHFNFQLRWAKKKTTTKTKEKKTNKTKSKKGPWATSLTWSTSK